MSPSPLKNKVDLKVKNGSLEVPIKYEKLPVFCYICGMLGHGEKDCDENSERRKFKEKLRVSTPWKAQKGEDNSEDSGKSTGKKAFHY